MTLWSGQGPVYVAKRDTNGNAQALRLIASCMVETTLNTTTTDHHESDSGQRVQDGRLITMKKASIKLTTDHWDIENLALGLYSTTTLIAAGTVTAEPMPAGLLAGDYVRTQFQDISTVALKDSAGTPATLVLGTDYEITSAKHGTIKILNVGAYTQPFTVAYAYAGGSNLAVFDTVPPELWIKVDAINTAVDGYPASLVEFYRVILDPVSALAVKNDAYGPLELNGSVLFDSTKALDATLGQFGRIIQMA